MIELLKDEEIPIVEDDVYSDLWFYEEDVPKMKLIKAMDPEGIEVCFTGSFSKILGPGLRLGWMLVPESIYQKCELIKQSIDACSPSISQVLADKFIRGGHIYRYVAQVREEYKKRGLAMIETLEECLPEYVDLPEASRRFLYLAEIAGKMRRNGGAKKSDRERGGLCNRKDIRSRRSKK